MNKDKSITPYNDKGELHGLCEWYSDGKLYFKRFFQNGRLVGYEEYYLLNGKLNRKRYYI